MKLLVTVLVTVLAPVTASHHPLERIEQADESLRSVSEEFEPGGGAEWERPETERPS